MLAQEILSSLRDSGFDITVAAGKLRIEPASQLTEQVRATLREHKAAIIQALAAESPARWWKFPVSRSDDAPF